MKNDSATGPDGIPAFVLKEIIYTILPILTILINKCLDLGIFPNSLKVARVTPVLKKGNPQNLTNYRPISILPIFSKIIEKLILTRLTSFVDKFNIISRKQFGFRERHSTQHAVIIDSINNINKNLFSNLPTICIFLDLQKAFDSVDRSILLEKLSHYGIRGNMHKLLQSYLCNK